MTGWRVAKSLLTLRAEFDRLAPNRSKRMDGTIGDPAHAARASRHNPNRYGTVTALDITHDPANGCDVHTQARWIANHPHPNLAYIISDGQIASRPGFRWRRYTGANPHTKHAHFAVGSGTDRDPRPPYDATTPWGLLAPESDVEETVLKRGDKGPAVRLIQRCIEAEAANAGRPDPLPKFGPDGDYGQETESAVAVYQGAARIPVTGNVDGLTAALLVRYER